MVLGDFEELDNKIKSIAQGKLEQVKDLQYHALQYIW